MIEREMLNMYGSQATHSTIHPSLMAGWLRGVLLGLLVLLAPVASAPPAGVVDLASVDAIEDAVASSNALLIAFLSEGCGERARAQAARRAEC